MSYRIEIVNDIVRGKELWKKIVDIKTLYDVWDFREAFFNPKYEINFVVAYENDTPVALLPLQNNITKGFLEFFGGDFMENNRIYALKDYDRVSKKLINHIDRQVKLGSLMPENDLIKSFKFMDNTYDLDISGFNSLDEFLQTHFSARKRKAFRRILRDFEDIPHTIVFDRWDDLEDMMLLNMERFEEDSAFNDKSRRVAFRNLVDADLRVGIMTILMDKIPVNISLFVEHRGIFYAIMSGTNVELPYDLRKYSLLKKFEYAIEHKFKKFDAARSDCNWKENWHLTPHPLYIYKNF